ncbi:hypothetical protein NESM_000428700 [Novymonas esmeraldas]|uniref:Uncharacterized protein n=1 Tax=Novymonas esmeraldas TaxID=1808958 RepID=A0AAW0EPI9_9TRYP
MGRGVKRKRSDTPSPRPSSRGSSSSSASRAGELPAATGAPPPKRGATNVHVVDADPVASEHVSPARSDESVRVESSREREEALLHEGSDLSGDALKQFLQKNFVDYVNETLFDAAALDALES